METGLIEKRNSQKQLERYHQLRLLSCCCKMETIFTLGNKEGWGFDISNLNGVILPCHALHTGILLFAVYSCNDEPSGVYPGAQTFHRKLCQFVFSDYSVLKGRK